MSDIEQFRDQRGELPPLWAAFADYERYSIGWRMGLGETYRYAWADFLETEVGTGLAGDALVEARLAYLRRHPKAPYSWADEVLWICRPPDGDNEDEDGSDVTPTQLAELIELKLVASDVAHATWCAADPDFVPWTHADWTPQKSARYDTRRLGFWSRRLAAERAAGAIRIDAATVPDAWKEVVESAQRGAAVSLGNGGLIDLAHLLAAGVLAGPWTAGLSVSDAADSYELDMGPVDAFRLYLTSILDDMPHAKRLAQTLALPAGPWQDWYAEQTEGLLG